MADFEQERGTVETEDFAGSMIGTAPDILEVDREAADRLRRETTGVRVVMRKMKTSVSLKKGQRERAAEPFEAVERRIRGTKRLLNNRNQHVLAVTAANNAIAAYVKSITIDYPERGVRLLNTARIQEFNQQMTALRANLKAAEAGLESHRVELLQEAREELGDLYDSGDFPASFGGQYDASWDFVAVEPPDYLRQLNPELYEREAAKIARRFELAVTMAEDAFVEELAKLIDHLTAKISGDDDGKKKIFRDSSVTNLREFFERFKSLDVGNSEHLTGLVSQAEQLLDGVEPDQLRSAGDVRNTVAKGLAGIRESLGGHMVDAPERAISLDDEL